MLRSSLPEPLRASTPAHELERAVQAILRAARQAWPGISIPDRDFIAYLAQRLPIDRPAAEGLALIHAADLYLAAGCARGDAKALRHFERRYLSSAEYLPKRAARGEVTDLLQTVRERLFLENGRSDPRISQYRGTGPLGAWVRVVAARASIDQLRGESPRAASDDGELELAAEATEPDLRLINEVYRQQLREVFQATLKSLSSREASLLRLHFLEGLGADGIARVYGASARSVRRWLADLRAEILERVRKRLKQEHGLAGSQLASIERFARERLDVTISALLKRSGRSGTPPSGA